MIFFTITATNPYWISRFYIVYFNLRFPFSAYFLALF
jgi:hypothetical protein